jgi:tetratricopeptide (TPR) repeat protein
VRKIAAVAALAAVALAAPAEAAKPNLKGTRVSAPPKTVAEYGEFKVWDTVMNAGKRRAGASVVRYYLSTDPTRSRREREESRTNPRTTISDILLEGVRPVPALDPRERSATKPRKPVKVRVPLGTLAREYFLLACADDRGDVTESKEADNCVASGKLAVTGLPAGPTTTFNDWLADRPDAEEAEDLAFVKRLACTPTPGGPALGLKQALANVDRFLKARAPEGVQQFAKSPAYGNANRAEASAAEALLRKSPGAALAATTRAHRLEPKEASHLVNAAGVATAVGLPREALALLDASVRLDDQVPGAWGFNRQALVLTNRAHALAALGRFSEAERLADAAEAIEPSLTEAAATSSTAALCQNNVPKAVQKLKRSRRRTPPVPVDESVGKEHPLRKVELPGFPGQAERLDAFYDSESAQRSGETQKRINKQNQLEAALRAKKVDRLSERQGGRLMSAVYSASETPRLKAQYAEVYRLVDEVQDYRIRFFCRDSDCEPEAHYYTQYFEEALKACEGSDEPNCFEREINDRCRPPLKSYHQGWLTRMEALWAATNVYHRALSKRMSAIAANIADPHRHALALLQIENLEDAHYHLVLQQAAFWAHDVQIRKDHCVEPYEDPATTPDAEAAAGSGSPCTSKTKPLNAVLSVGPGALKLNCEEIQFEADTGGWIAAFGEISYDYKAGTITVFAGSKGSLGAPGIKGEFKSGLYIRVGNDGFQDAGWRVGPQLTVGAGPVEYAPKDEMDMSFVGIFSGGAQ